MRYHWIYYFGLFVALILAEILSFPLQGNLNDGQTIEYNPFSSASFSVADASSICIQQKQKKSCEIHVKKLGRDFALLIDPVDHKNFIYPNENGTITLKQNQDIFLSCPGLNNSLVNVPGALSYSNFTCICGSIFNVYNAILNLYNVTCKLPPQYEIIDKGFYGRESEYRRFEIGFRTDLQNSFLKVIDVHYDRSTASTIYTKSTVSRFIAGRQKLAKQDRYDQTYCCERQRNRLDMDAIYDAKTQDRSFAVQLYCHDSEFRTKCSYLDESSDLILSQGQLTPKSSFIYTSASSATFIYLNTGPQWRSMNEGNWARIEEHVIEMTKDLQKDLVVYSGVYDKLRLEDTGDNNQEKIIFLYGSENNDRLIPVPLYFWKIIHEPSSKRGVVFVTVNNPHIKRGEDYHICKKPIFDKDDVRFPKQWIPKSIVKGYSYMCEVPDFIRSNSIMLDDFSVSSVTDLLYLMRKSNHDSLMNESSENEMSLNNELHSNEALM